MNIIYILGGLILVGIGMFIFYKVTRDRDDWAVKRRQAVKIEERRINKKAKNK